MVTAGTSLFWPLMMPASNHTLFTTLKSSAFATSTVGPHAAQHSTAVIRKTADARARIRPILSVHAHFDALQSLFFGQRLGQIGEKVRALQAENPRAGGRIGRGQPRAVVVAARRNRQPLVRLDPKRAAVIQHR